MCVCELQVNLFLFFAFFGCKPTPLLKDISAPTHAKFDAVLDIGSGVLIEDYTLLHKSNLFSYFFCQIFFQLSRDITEAK